MLEASDKGDLDRLKQLSTGMSELTTLSAQDPTLIPSLASLAICSMHLDAVYRGVAMHRNDTAWQAFCRTVKLDTSIVNAVVAIRFDVAGLLPHISKGDPASLDSAKVNALDPEFKKHPLPTGPGARDAMIVWLLRDYTALSEGFRAAGDDPDAQILFSRTFKQKLEQDRHPARNLSRFLVEPDAVLPFCTALIKLECLRLASLLFDYRREKGAFPEVLAFDNPRHLLYKKTKAGFKLYSVAHSGTDNYGPGTPGLHKSATSYDWGLWFEPDDPKLVLRDAPPAKV